MFFWIIVLSFLVPVAMRLYRRSARGRNQGTPGQFGRFPGSQNNPGPEQPAAGWLHPAGLLRRLRPAGRPEAVGSGQRAVSQPAVPQRGVPERAEPPSPVSGPAVPEPAVPRPAVPEPGRLPVPRPVRGQPRVPEQPAATATAEASQTPPAPGAGQAQAPQSPPPPSAGQGYRARKLAELDQQYTDGKLSMEDYMAQRAEIMKG